VATFEYQSCFSFEEAAKAQEMLENRQTTGKVILTME